MLYFIKSPRWLQQLFPGRIWKFSSEIKNIYLTFDDGPHPLHTPFVLDLLKNIMPKQLFFVSEIMSGNILKSMIV